MRIVKKVKIVLEAPVPVYDVTSPKYHNLVLANGCVVHNSAKAARDPRFQEVLCMQGKIVNAVKEKLDRVLSSPAVIDMLQAVGYDPKHPDPENHLRVGKIIIASDADVDGKHIDALQLSLWYSIMPKLFIQGRVFLVRSYEFVTRKNGTTIFADSLEEMRDKCGGTLPKEVTQLKGLGEMAASDLRDMAFNKNTRQLWKVRPPLPENANKFSLIMGSDPSFRKKMLGV